MSGRFDYVKFDEDSAALIGKAKANCMALEKLIEESIPNSREKSLALTKLEETYMWIGKATRDLQIEKNGAAEPQESRVNI